MKSDGYLWMLIGGCLIIAAVGITLFSELVHADPFISNEYTMTSCDGGVCVASTAAQPRFTQLPNRTWVSIPDSIDYSVNSSGVTFVFGDKSRIFFPGSSAWVNETEFGLEWGFKLSVASAASNSVVNIIPSASMPWSVSGDKLVFGNWEISFSDLNKSTKTFNSTYSVSKTGVTLVFNSSSPQSIDFDPTLVQVSAAASAIVQRLNDQAASYVKFPSNTTYVPAGVTIADAEYCLYRFAWGVDWTSKLLTAWNATDDWNESSTAAQIRAVDYNSTLNKTTVDAATIGWLCWNVTNAYNWSYGLGLNLSIRLNQTLTGTGTRSVNLSNTLAVGYSIITGDFTDFYSRSGTYPPQLNVTYFYPSTWTIPRLNSPPNQTILSNSTLVFGYTPLSTGRFVKATLLTNFTNTWTVNNSNASAITNNSLNTITVNLGNLADGTYKWNIVVFDNYSINTTNSSNYSFTLWRNPPLVNLNAPINFFNHSTSNSFIDFWFTPKIPAKMAFNSTTLYTNFTGAWLPTAGNASAAANNSLNVIEVTTPAANAYVWNILVCGNPDQGTNCAFNTTKNYTLNVTAGGGVASNCSCNATSNVSCNATGGSGLTTALIQETLSPSNDNGADATIVAVMFAMGLAVAAIAFRYKSILGYLLASTLFFILGAMLFGGIYYTVAGTNNLSYIYYSNFFIQSIGVAMVVVAIYLLLACVQEVMLFMTRRRSK